MGAEARARQEAEVSALDTEADMPLEQLLAMYGGYTPGAEESPQEDDKPPSTSLQQPADPPATFSKEPAKTAALQPAAARKAFDEVGALAVKAW